MPYYFQNFHLLHGCFLLYPRDCVFIFFNCVIESIKFNISLSQTSSHHLASWTIYLWPRNLMLNKTRTLLLPVLKFSQTPLVPVPQTLFLLLGCLVLPQSDGFCLILLNRIFCIRIRIYFQ